MHDTRARKYLNDIYLLHNCKKKIIWIIFEFLKLNPNPLNFFKYFKIKKI